MFIQNKTEFKLTPGNIDKVYNTLPSAVYTMTVNTSMFGSTILFNPIDLYEKGTIVDGGIYKEIRQYISDFLSPEMDMIRKAMVLQKKTGLIFNGEPGTGKTFLAGQIAEELVKEYNAIGIITNEFDSLDLSKLIETIRENDKERLIVLILDEFEKADYNNQGMLAYLDGAGNVDNIITIATVNSILHLPKTLTDRPGRFEKIYSFDAKNPNIARVMIKSLLPEQYINKVNIDLLVKDTIISKKNTIDYIRLSIRNVLLAIEQKNNDVKERNLSYDQYIIVKTIADIVKEE